MQGSRIYSDFDSEIAWISGQVARDVQSLDPSVRSLARFYTQVRLRVLQGGRADWVIERRMGRLIPYVAFWFSDALGLTNSRLRRLSGLSLVYNAITIAFRDDIADSASTNKSGLEGQQQFWAGRFAETLAEIFPDERAFRKAAASGEAEYRKYERWQSSPLAATQLRPFSAGFLAESTRGTVACILPSLVAIAHAAGRKKDVPRIERFLWEYSMAWRIFDDLMDWEEDLGVKDMNRSSVLMYVGNKIGHKQPVDRLDVLSWFLSEKFVEDAYGTMIGYFSKARSTVASFGSPYLDEFMKEEISFQIDKRKEILTSASLTISDLGEGITSVLGHANSSTPPKRESHR